MKQNYLFLTAAVTSLLMLSACTSKDETVTIVSNQGNELMISTRNDMAITRADGGTAENPGLQQSQFDPGETIDVFLQDATDPSTGTSYSYPIKYRTDGNGNLYTYNYTPEPTPTLPHATAPYDHWYDGFTPGSSPSVNRLFWPKLTHALNIYGVYPEGAVSSNTKVGGSFLPFSDTEKYTFSVQVDQTDYEAYKESDLMTGRPITYGDYLTLPYELEQTENPGIITLTFAHRLTKIVVNVTKTKDTEDTDIDIDAIKYDGPSDKKYAVVTLMGIDKTIQFLVNSEDGLGSLSGSATTNIIVGKGAVTRTISISAPAYPGAILTPQNYTAVSLAAIIPPQTITAGNLFIKVELRDDDLGTPIYDTFYYNAPSNITLSPKNVYTYNIRISKPHIDVTTTITPWTPNDPTNAIGVLQ